MPESISLNQTLFSDALVDLCKEGGASNIIRFFCSATERIADEIIIATITSWPMLDSLTEEIRSFLKETHRLPFHGVPRHNKSGWIVIDCGEVIIHLMNSECRSYYQLEDLYALQKATCERVSD